MEGITGRIDRLYELYVQHFSRLKTDVGDINRSLDSNFPEKTWMELLSRSDFESRIESTERNEEQVQLWVRRLIRGFEHEFPDLRVA